MSARRIIPLCIALLVLSLGVGGRTAEPDPELTAAENVLKEKGVPTDGAGLLKYFKDRTLSQADLDRLAGIVRKLGDNDFDTREKATRDLIAAGRPAVTLLKVAAMDPDPE